MSETKTTDSEHRRYNLRNRKSAVNNHNQCKINEYKGNSSSFVASTDNLKGSFMSKNKLGNQNSKLKQTCFNTNIKNNKKETRKKCNTRINSDLETCLKETMPSWEEKNMLVYEWLNDTNSIIHSSKDKLTRLSNTIVERNEDVQVKHSVLECKPKKQYAKKHSSKQAKKLQRNNDAAIKAKALEDGKKLKVCLERIVLYGKNSNIISNPMEKPKICQGNNKEDEAQNDREVKWKYNAHSNLNTVYESKETYGTNEYFVSELNLLESQNLSSIVSLPEIIDSQIAELTNFNDIKEKELSLQKETKNLECTSPKDINKLKKLPVIINENMLPKDTVRINKSVIYVNEINNDNNERTVPSQIISNENAQEISLDNNKESLHDKKKYLLKNSIQNHSFSVNDAQTKENEIEVFNKENNNLLKDEIKHQYVDISSKCASFTSSVNDIANSSSSLNNKCSTDTESTNIMLNNINTVEYNNTSKRKHASQIDSKDEEKPKRIKLNRNRWCESFAVERSSDNQVNNFGILHGFLQKKNSRNSVNVDEINVAKDDGNVAKEIAKVKSQTDSNGQRTSVLIQPTHVESFRDVNYKQECKPQQNIRKGNGLISKAVRTQNSFSDEAKPADGTIADEEYEDDDCISLFADSALMDDFSCIKDMSFQQEARNSLYTEKAYVMTDNMFENFYKNTTAEFNKAYNTNGLVENKTPTMNINNGEPIAKKPLVPNNTFITNQTHQTTKLGVLSNSLYKTILSNFCFALLKYGNCTRRVCHFYHDILPRFFKLYYSNEQHFYIVLEQMVYKKHIKFLRGVLHQLMDQTKDIVWVLKVLKKLYELKVLTDPSDCNISKLLDNEISMKMIVTHLTTILNENDSEFIQWILPALKACISHGTYWNTLRNILLRMNKIEPGIVNYILLECVQTQKNVRDIHENLMLKLDKQITSKVLPGLRQRFNELLELENNGNKVKEEVPRVQSVVNIGSPDHANQDGESCVRKYEHWEDRSCKMDNNNNENSFRLQLIDNLPRPYSENSRERFWKFYVEVHSLKEGLKHNDYEYVFDILKKANANTKSVFTRACYKILLNEIQYSQQCLNKLISLAVRYGATATFYDIIIDVAIYVLVYLADKELWLLAFKLFKDINLLIRARLDNLDALTVILFAQIYLANRRPFQAFDLLKQSNIIYTNPSKWNVTSTAKAERARSQIIPMLFDSLCAISVECASFFFEFLINDQSSNFYPVDLTLLANNLVSAVLLKAGHDCEEIISIGKLIEKYNIALRTITYRALIATLVNMDLESAKQFYYCAVSLGIYSEIQFSPAICVIINCDWTREEMYLVTSILIEQLLLNVGHAIDHINPNKLEVNLVFELIPLEAQLARDEGFNEQYEQKLRESKKLMKNILEKQFKPSIFCRKVDKGKAIKLNSKSLLCHLKSQHVH